jgi:hypothetical protein
MSLQPLRILLKNSFEFISVNSYNDLVNRRRVGSMAPFQAKVLFQKRKVDTDEGGYLCITLSIGKNGKDRKVENVV